MKDLQSITCTILLILSFAVNTSFGNWGMEVGRANESDVVRLLSD